MSKLTLLLFVNSRPFFNSNEKVISSKFKETAQAKILMSQI